MDLELVEQFLLDLIVSVPAWWLRLRLFLKLGFGFLSECIGVVSHRVASLASSSYTSRIGIPKPTDAVGYYCITGAAT
jgi:hypothetical protein